MDEKATVRFDTIAGVPVSYDRDTHASYGTRGRVMKKLGPVTPRFFKALEACVEEIGELCPWGKPELIVTGGVHGDGTDPANRHSQGRAFDLDGLWWPSRPPLVAKKAPDTPILYCAVDAVLRRHVGTVLNYWYNAAHQDHWHIDDGSPVAWQPSRSRVLALQAALVHVWDASLDLDGVWGPKTLGAYRAALRTFLCDETAAGWLPFLQATAKRGFDRAAPANL